MNQILWVTYLMANFIMVIYFVMLGSYMLNRRSNVLSTHGEQVAKQRMTRTMGVAVMVMAFDWLIYLPPMLYGCPSGHIIYKVLFLIELALNTPVIYMVMFAVVQRRVNILRWICALSTPFLLLAVWQATAPALIAIRPHIIGAILSLASYLFLLIKFASEYGLYVRRIQSEYSETTSREIAWSWTCFAGLSIQGTLFVLYELFWTPQIEILYLLFSIFNATYLCFCTCRQRTIDLDVVPETEYADDADNPIYDKSFYYSIERRLKPLCEDKLLFLNPDFTLEMLTLRLGINRTYLSMYFRKRETTFYQYINTLRVEYAYKLMQEEPHLSIRKVVERSGFRSQTTFRKMFLEVMGCLPSEVRKRESNLSPAILQSLRSEASPYRDAERPTREGA